MKKLVKFLMASAMVFALAACSNSTNGGNDGKKYDIVMLTDKGTIDDKSFNQGTYEGVKAFGDENNISYTYIKPEDANDEAYKAAIDDAIKAGAKVVVTPGYLFETAVGEKQNEYTDVKFVAVDFAPKGGTASNAVSIMFKEQEAGYLAGYAAVKDGATKLGFLGGMAVPAVKSFGFGYIQGANDAAKELGVNVEMMYHYTGGFDATPAAQTLASSWYKDGVSHIFGCGGAVGNSAMQAASAAGEGKYVIGVDVDQSGESETVVSSAMKQLAPAVQSVLADIFNDQFKGGETMIFGAKENSVGLPMASSKWSKFTQEEYDAIYKQIQDGKITIKAAADFESEDPEAVVETLGLTNIKVTYAK